MVTTIFAPCVVLVPTLLVISRIGDSLDLLLESGVDIRRRNDLFHGDLGEDERVSLLAAHEWLRVAIVAGRRRGLKARHGTWLHVGTGNGNFSKVVYRDNVEPGGRQSKFKKFTSGLRLELKVLILQDHRGSYWITLYATGSYWIL